MLDLNHLLKVIREAVTNVVIVVIGLGIVVMWKVLIVTAWNTLYEVTTFFLREKFKSNSKVNVGDAMFVAKQSKISGKLIKT